MDKKELVFVTSNKNKIKEIKCMVESEVKNVTISYGEYAYPELQHEEIEFVAKESAKYIRKEKEMEKPFFIEDSGLFIHALNGFPGPFSAYVFNKIGNDGILKLLLGVKEEQRTATFKSVVALCLCECESTKEEPILFTGIVEGKISNKIRGGEGEGGFGYDPIFEFETKTFAEMSIKEKNEVSHRGKAFRKLLHHFG
jgi:XTP/dITP diphosphohydrolase